MVVSVLTAKGPRRRALRFVKRVIFLSEETENRDIKNLDTYLASTERAIQQMRQAGASDVEIKKVVTQLQLVPLLAQRDALVAKRLSEAESVSVPSLEQRQADTAPASHLIETADNRKLQLRLELPIPKPRPEADPMASSENA